MEAENVIINKDKINKINKEISVKIFLEIMISILLIRANKIITYESLSSKIKLFSKINIYSDDFIKK